MGPCRFNPCFKVFAQPTSFPFLSLGPYKQRWFSFSTIINDNSWPFAYLGLNIPPPFKQFIGKSFQHLQESILKCVHQHSLSILKICASTFFSKKGVWNLLNPPLFIIQASWFKVQLTILIFCLPLTMFATIFWILLGLLHLSMASLLCCVCT